MKSPCFSLQGFEARKVISQPTINHRRKNRNKAGSGLVLSKKLSVSFILAILSINMCSMPFSFNQQDISEISGNSDYCEKFLKSTREMLFKFLREGGGSGLLFRYFFPLCEGKSDHVYNFCFLEKSNKCDGYLFAFSSRFGGSRCP